MIEFKSTSLLVLLALANCVSCDVSGDFDQSAELLPFSMFRTSLRHEKLNCTPPTIDDFPPDMFTPEERQQGAVVVHVFLAVYVMIMIAVVVDDYFVPCLEIIGEVLHMSPNIAGATIMAVGTSSPELFTNLVGTFVTQGDIGVGTIVGSAVFNILAAPACCGLITGFVVPLEWWPLTRDCVIYGSIVIGLAVVLSDGLIYWHEALVLVCCYILYLTIMYLNRPLERVANRIVKRFRSTFCDKESSAASSSQDSELEGSKEEGLENPGILACSTIEEEMKKHQQPVNGESVVEPESSVARVDKIASSGEEDSDGPVEMFKFPEDASLLKKLWWIFLWPGNLVFFLTVPDVRRQGIWRRLFPLTFLMCVIWIGSLTYLVTWFITVIGYTLGAPDSVMGITFLAAGGSVPEAVATVVVARQGKGSMGISNSVGSNSFDIMICMGIPWLIKAAAFPAYPDEGNFVAINSGGVVYSVLMLFCTILILYFAIAFNKFQMNRVVGGVLLASYILFLILAALFELNVFMYVNNPTCPE